MELSASRHNLNAPALGSLSCSYKYFFVYYKYLRALGWPVGHTHNIKTMNDLYLLRPRGKGASASKVVFIINVNYIV